MHKNLFLTTIFLSVSAVSFGQGGWPDKSFKGQVSTMANIMEVYKDGSVLIVTGHNNPDKIFNQTLYKLKPNGDRDSSFNYINFGDPGNSYYDRVRILNIQPLKNDTFLLAGSFDVRTSPNPWINLARLLPNGTIDKTFVFDNPQSGYETITNVFINNAGEIIVGGDYIFTRVQRNGKIDEKFFPSYFNGYPGRTIETIGQFSNNKYLVGGNFTAIYGSYLMRCDSVGKPDTSWKAGKGFNDVVKKVFIQTDQKIVVWGDFTKFNGTTVYGLCRLNEDGTLDTTFKIKSGVTSGKVYDIAMQPNGKIILAGIFSGFNGYNNFSAIRLLSNGNPDSSFGNSKGVSLGSSGNTYYPGSIRHLVLTPDDKLVVNGTQISTFYDSAGNSIHQSTNIMRLFACSPTAETQKKIACDSFKWINGNTYYANNNTAKYTYKGSGGCDVTATLNLTVTPTVETQIYSACDSFKWINGNTYYANNNTAKYTYKSSGGCDVTATLNLTITPTVEMQIKSACDSFKWINGITYYANNNTAKHTYKGSGGCDVTATLNLTISPDATASIKNDTLSADLFGAKYQWIDCDNGNAPILGDTNKIFIPKRNGNYAVAVTLDNCKSISNCVNFKLNSGNISSNKKLNLVTIFPNPATNEVTVSINNDETETAIIEIISTDGKVQLSTKAKTIGNTILNIADLQAGIYNVQITQANGYRTTKYLVVF